MLEAGAIRPSQSPWCNAVLLVQKRIDLFNSALILVSTHGQRRSLPPLPRIQEALESMARATHFSTMDAFMVGNLGFYEFTRMPFGFCSTPATFQHLMQNTLGELNLTYCIIYLDGVIMFGHTEEEHLEHLWVVFEHFWEFNLKLKPSKCSFFQTEIVYLIHHISKEGICPSEENVHAIMEFPMLETYTEVRAFYGLSGHYHHFIKNFACLAHAQYILLGDKVKKEPVMLTPEARGSSAGAEGEDRISDCTGLP